MRRRRSVEAELFSSVAERTKTTPMFFLFFFDFLIHTKSCLSEMSRLTGAHTESIRHGDTPVVRRNSKLYHFSAFSLVSFDDDLISFVCAEILRSIFKSRKWLVLFWFPSRIDSASFTPLASPPGLLLKMGPVFGSVATKQTNEPSTEKVALGLLYYYNQHRIFTIMMCGNSLLHICTAQSLDSLCTLPCLVCLY